MDFDSFRSFKSHVHLFLDKQVKLIRHVTQITVTCASNRSEKNADNGAKLI